MATIRNRWRRREGVSINMTPMIDVVFLLIIFFMLVSNFATAENVLLELPHPYKSQAKKVKLTDRVILNCQFATDGASYRIGPNPSEPLERVAARLAAAKAAADAQGRELIVVIRADRRLAFADVRAAIQVVADNEIEQLRLVAQAGEES
jgi:biopolymer transport protein ExbD